MTMNIQVLIPAAGTGARMGGELPKQFQPFRGRPVIEWTLDAFGLLDSIAPDAQLKGIHVVYAQGLENEARAQALEATLVGRRAALKGRLHSHFVGAATRAQTVRNGLREIARSGSTQDDWVWVHDAARPGIDGQAMGRLIEAMRQLEVAPAGSGALLAMPVVDTVKRFTQGQCETVPRADLWLAQTPQCFRLQALLAALEMPTSLSVGCSVTDEASAVEAVYPSPQILPVLGDLRNLKLTVPKDFERLERLW